MNIVAADELLLMSAHTDGDRKSVLSLCGELDCSNAAQVAHIVEGLLDEEPRVLLIDVSALRYIDSLGVDMLLRVRRDAQHRNVELHATGMSGIVARVFDILGVTSLLRA